MAFFAPTNGERSNMIRDGDYKRYEGDELVTCARPPIRWHMGVTGGIDDYVDLSDLATDGE